MLLSLLKLSKTSLSVLSRFGHVFIQPLDLLSLLLGLHGYVLGNEVDVLHNGFDLCDIFLALLDDLLHVVDLGVDLNLFLSLDLLLQRLSLVNRSASETVPAFLRQINEHLFLFLDLLGYSFEFLSHCFQVLVVRLRFFLLQG